MNISEKNKANLLSYAKRAIEFQVLGEKKEIAKLEQSFLQEKHGIFLTIYVDGKLRGSLGFVETEDSLLSNVIEISQALCRGNDSYPKIEKHELNYLTIQINIISSLKQIYDKSEIDIGKHGLYVNHPNGQGLIFSSQAVERDFSQEIFLNEVCHKAGLPSFTWEDDECKVYIFESIVFSDKNRQ